MKYYTIPPPVSLARYVRCFWVLEHDGPYIYRSLADGCAEMVFHYHGVFDEILATGNIEASFTAGIHGQSRHSRRFITHTGFAIFGVYIYPFAVAELLKIPACNVSDEMPDLVTLLGQEGHVLQERIMGANNNRERVEIIIPFLEKRLCGLQHSNAAVVHVINELIHKKGQVDVDTLAGACFLSRRQFERNFKNYAGFSPKLYARIIRFQAATKQYGMHRKSLTDIAHYCGYYDQSHFIHDFKEFSGFHPKEYFYGKPEGMDYRDVNVEQ